LDPIVQQEFPPAAAEIERNHVVDQERIVLAAGCPNERAPIVPQPLNKFDAVSFIRSNT